MFVRIATGLILLKKSNVGSIGAQYVTLGQESQKHTFQLFAITEISHQDYALSGA